MNEIDRMQALGSLAAGGSAAGNEEFDLTSDELVDVTDRDERLARAAAENGLGSPYQLGDASLNGVVVDGQDFIAWNAYRFRTDLRWSEGDVNTNDMIDGEDFRTGMATNSQFPTARPRYRRRPGVRWHASGCCYSAF